MKNLQKLFSMTMLVCMAIAMFSCSKDEEEIVVTEADVMGTWNVTSVDSDLSLSDFAKVDFTTIFSGEDISLTPGYTLTFDEESKLTVGVVINSFDGIWKLDGKSLYLSKEEEEDGTEYVIQSINQESAVLIQPVTSGDASFNYIINLEKK